MKYIFLLTGLFSFQILPAQVPFEKVFGGVNAESFTSVIQTSDQGFLAGGTTQSFGYGTVTVPDFFLVKTNSNGDTLWTKSFGTPSYEYARKVFETTDHHLFITGFGINPANNSYDFYVVKTDANGNKIWDYYYGGASTDVLYDALPVADGKIILCGSTLSFGSGGNDFYIVEIDSAGNMLRDQSIGSTGNEVAEHIEQTSDGGYAIVGYTNSNTPGFDIYLVKTDSDFNIVWSRNFGTTGNDYGYDVKQDDKKNFMMIGIWQNGIDTSKMVLIKTDSLGLNPIIKFPGTHAGDYGYSLDKTSNGDFIIAGYTQAQNKGSEMLLMKTNANGDTIWSKHFGGTKSEVAFVAITLADGGYILAGETEGFGVNNVDGYLVRVDSAGDTPCPDSLYFSASAEVLCEDENVFFTNTTVSSQNFTWLQDGNSFSNYTDAGTYFNAAGVYQITLSACTLSSSKIIQVNAKPPVTFTYASAGDTVYFSMNTQMNVSHLSWNFGDGTTEDTIDPDPVHVYSHQEMYWVILSAIDSNGCDSTFKNQIDVITGVKEVEENKFSFSISPNPVKDEAMLIWNDETDFPLKAEIINLSGEMVRTFSIHHKKEIFSVKGMQPGMYLLRCTNTYEENFVRKMIVE